MTSDVTSGSAYAPSDDPTLAATAAGGADSTRQRLIDAAAQVFSEKGYDGTRVQEIARRAGLTTGAIYANFSGKAELLLEVVTARGGAELDDLLRQEGPRRDKSTLDLLADLGASLAEPMDAEQSALLFEAFAAARRDTDVKKFLDARFIGVQSQLRKVAERIQDEGLLAENLNLDVLVRFCHALTLGMVVFEAIGLPPPDPDGWSDLIHRVAYSVTRDAPPGLSAPREEPAP